MACVVSLPAKSDDSIPESHAASRAHQSVGLVLSGGGAKGIAHIGVIQALEDHDIPIDFVAGTSMGAIVGGLYAAGYTCRNARPDSFQRFCKLVDRAD